jgi:hypothetical protein
MLSGEHEGTMGEKTSDDRSMQSDKVRNALLWVGAVAAVSAVAAFIVVRATVGREAPSDPTSDRIQALIDEANQLLKTLDTPKQG